MFDTRWATGIEYVKSVFASLSLKYSTQTKVFLHVDVTNLQSLAKELQINISGYSGEVPVFICFSKGKEVTRVPQLSSKPRITPYRWTEDLLCKALSL